MNTTHTLSLATIGVIGLAAFGAAQERGSQTPEATFRQESRGSEQGLQEIEQARMQLEQKVSQKVSEKAREFQVQVNPSAVTVSLFGRGGMLAAAPAYGSTSMRENERGATDPAERDRERQGQDQPERRGGQQDEEDDESPLRDVQRSDASSGERATEGIVLVSSELLARRGTSPRPAGTDGQSERQTGQGQESDRQFGQQQQTDRQFGHQSGQSSEFTTYKIRCKPQTQDIELIDQSGNVAMTIPLLEIQGQGAASHERLTSAPRPAGQDDEKLDRERSGVQSASFQSSKKKNDWKTVYASIVWALTSEE